MFGVNGTTAFQSFSSGKFLTAPAGGAAKLSSSVGASEQFVVSKAGVSPSSFSVQALSGKYVSDKSKGAATATSASVGVAEVLNIDGLDDLLKRSGVGQIVSLSGKKLKAGTGGSTWVDAESKVSATVGADGTISFVGDNYKSLSVLADGSLASCGPVGSRSVGPEGVVARKRTVRREPRPSLREHSWRDALRPPYQETIARDACGCVGSQVHTLLQQFPPDPV